VNLFFFGHISATRADGGSGRMGCPYCPWLNPAEERERAVNIIRLAGQLRTEGLGQRVVEAVMPFVQEQLGAQVKGGGVAFGG
jgi:hypothetical protein